MQIKTGQAPNTTCSVTHDSNVVTAAAGSDWSQVVAGNWLTIAGSFVVYQVADCALVSSVWTLHLSTNYSGSTNAAATYDIQKDFDSNGWTIFATGDTEILPLLNRWGASISATVAALQAAGAAFANARSSPTDSTFQVKNQDTGLFHTLQVRGTIAGEETIEVVTPGES